MISWRPIETAPKTGARVWLYTKFSGIKLARWYSAEAWDIIEGTNNPDLYEPGWYEFYDPTEECISKWWIPYDELPEPPKP